MNVDDFYIESGGLSMKAMPLGQILIDEGIINSQQLEQALVQQRATKKRLGAVLAELGFATEKDILKPLAKRLGVEYLESPIFSVELDAVRLVPESLAKDIRSFLSILKQEH
jgi:hypothetical protein